MSGYKYLLKQQHLHVPGVEFPSFHSIFDKNLRVLAEHCEAWFGEECTALTYDAKLQ